MKNKILTYLFSFAGVALIRIVTFSVAFVGGKGAFEGVSTADEATAQAGPAIEQQGERLEEQAGGVTPGQAGAALLTLLWFGFEFAKSHMMRRNTKTIQAVLGVEEDGVPLDVTMAAAFDLNDEQARLEDKPVLRRMTAFQERGYLLVFAALILATFPSCSVLQGVAGKAGALQQYGDLERRVYMENGTVVYEWRLTPNLGALRDLATGDRGFLEPGGKTPIFDGLPEADATGISPRLRAGSGSF